MYTGPADVMWMTRHDPVDLPGSKVLIYHYRKSTNC
uniref:Uncharacterized protein n=1 Tax=Arundo donax TaxID=35708 RepID=A0A0A9EJP0_ARUDO